MAINKVINHATKSHGALKNVIAYALRDEKVREGYVHILGPYPDDAITSDGVYRAFLEEKKLWQKDSGRMYAHNIISFHKDERLSPLDCLEIGSEFADIAFPRHQSLISVHQDRDHLHCHIITNSVSFVDGKKLHQTKHDLQRQKDITNQLCQSMRLSIAQKGHHFDGSPMPDGEVITWEKDKFHLLQNDPRKSYVANCGIAVLKTYKTCESKKDFIQQMASLGWTVHWTSNRKHIVFENEKGEKVRDSNLSKTFSIDIRKESLLLEFERYHEQQLAERKAREDRERKESEQFDRYYRELESILSGTGLASQTGGGAAGPEQDAEEKEQNDTKAFLRNLRSKERASRKKRNDNRSEHKNTGTRRKRNASGRKQKSEESHSGTALRNQNREGQYFSDDFSL